jgi:hypothetical protein
MSVEQAVKYLKTCGIHVHEAAQEKYAHRLALLQGLFGGFISERAFSDDLYDVISHPHVTQDCRDFQGRWDVNGDVLVHQYYNGDTVSRVEVAIVPDDYNEWLLDYTVDLSNEELETWDLLPNAKRTLDFLMRYYSRNVTIRVRDKPYLLWALYTIDRCTLEHVEAEPEVATVPTATEFIAVASDMHVGQMVTNEMLTTNVMGGSTTAWPFAPGSAPSTTAATYTTASTLAQTSASVSASLENLRIQVAAMARVAAGSQVAMDHWIGIMQTIRAHGADVRLWPVYNPYLGLFTATYGTMPHQWPADVHQYLREQQPTGAEHA